jgi:hypothetical protein
MESDGKDHAMLFPDLKALVIKNPDDFKALVWLRISEHKAREEAQREKIRKEAQDKLVAENIATETKAAAPQAEQVNPLERASPNPARVEAAAPIDDGSIFNAILRVIDDFSQRELQQVLDAVLKIKAAQSCKTKSALSGGDSLS